MLGLEPEPAQMAVAVIEQHHVKDHRILLLHRSEDQVVARMHYCVGLLLCFARRENVVAEDALDIVAGRCDLHRDVEVDQRRSADPLARPVVRIERKHHGSQEYHPDCGLRLELSMRLVGGVEWFQYCSDVEASTESALCAVFLFHSALYLFAPTLLAVADADGVVPPFHARGRGSEDHGEVDRSSFLVVGVTDQRTSERKMS